MVTTRTANLRPDKFANRDRAKQMRHDPVATERHFWSLVRNRKLAGQKFRRQYMIGPYIAGYVCVEARLIIELDGPGHDENVSYDEKRDAYLRAQGYRVMRFRNEAVANGE